MSKKNISPTLDLEVLKLQSIKKRFPGVLALDDVDLSLNSGECHVLFGENGAGKSTLISIISGVYKPNSGEIFYKGRPVKLNSVFEARKLGINAVFQEFSLVGDLRVYENLFLGAEVSKLGKLNSKYMINKTQEILNQLEFDIKPQAKVEYLSRAQQQMVEIAKAFVSDVKILILDEPTASLTDEESRSLFKLIDKLKSNGVAIIYITHRMQEIRRIADRITVLRDGKNVDTIYQKTVSEHRLIEMMSGKKISQIYPKIKTMPKKEILKIENLHTKDGRVRGVDIKIKSGELLGIAGLVGSGKSKMMRAAFGCEKIKQGKALFNGQDITNLSIKKTLETGFYYLPSDRKLEGLVGLRSCKENITLAAVYLKKFLRFKIIKSKYESRLAYDLAKKLNLQPLKIDRSVEHFSGGNQQKVMLAKSLTRNIKLFVFDEPTVGVDVATRVEIYKFIAKLISQNAAVIIISSDLHEVINMSQRMYVMYSGVVNAELKKTEITERNVLKNFFETPKTHKSANL